MIGSPIAHSLSPRIHLAVYEELGLDATFTRVEVPPSEFHSRITGDLQRFDALAVTMPLKHLAFEVASSNDEPSAALGVCNTILRAGDQWSGHNTDVIGLHSALRDLVKTTALNALVIGSGATTASTLYALAELRYQRVTLAARNVERAAELATQWQGKFSSIDVVPLEDLETFSGGFDVVVSAIPASASAELSASAPLIASSALLELSYDPLDTPLLRLWRGQGSPAFDGLELLTRQALAQVGLFFPSVRPELERRREELIERMRNVAVTR